MATMDIDQEIEKRLATLGKHVLRCTSKTPEATVYRMGEPGTRNMSVVLVFVREPENRIILTGDIILGDGNGLVSDLGYTEGWFAGQLGPHYVAEKFLRKTYTQEHAVAWIEGEIQETKSLLDGDEAELKRLEKRLEELEDGLRRKGTVTQDARAFGEFFESIMGDGPCEGEGCGYESGVYAWLSAVQQRFAKLRAELRAREEKEGHNTEHVLRATVVGGPIALRGYDSLRLSVEHTCVLPDGCTQNLPPGTNLIMNVPGGGLEQIRGVAHRADDLAGIGGGES